jgi:NADPH-dependent glutamate synthase beta subunit-like oxidoreductase
MLRSVSTLTRCLNSKTPKRRYDTVFKSILRARKAEYHCCIVGSGPAALYTAEEIKKKISHDAKIDFYERLPTPFGLIRYGVAPGK